MLFFPSSRGVARRTAQTDSVRVLAGRGARLPARHMRSCSEAVAHAICGACSTPGPALRPKAFPETCLMWRPSGGGPLSVAGYGRAVSQLLTGTRVSGPGGSPGPSPRTPRDDALKGRGDAHGKRGYESGDRFQLHFPITFVMAGLVPPTRAEALLGTATSRRFGGRRPGHP